MNYKLLATTAMVASLFNSALVIADDTLVVTANRFAQNSNDVLADVDIIERNEIEKIQPRTLVDLLEGVAGIDVVKRGGHGQQSSVFVRGSSSNQTLILIDGVRVGSATLGEKSLSSIPVSQIERIEIVKGPRAAVWGSDAIGGVIQIFTRRFATGEHQAAVTFGSNDSQARELSVGFGSDRFSNTFSYAMQETQGIDARIGGDLDDDGSSFESYALRGDYQLSSELAIDWLVQQDRANSEFDTSWGGDRTRTDNQLYRIRLTTDLNGWNTSFLIGHSEDKSVTFDQDLGIISNDAFVTEKNQLNITTYKPLAENFTLIGGLDWYQDDISQTTTQYAQSQRVTKSGLVGLNWRNQDWLAESTVRYDDVENVDTQTTINASLGYQLTSAHLISINFAEGFKAPSFNDLYYPWGGNDSLTFETSDSTELLYKANFDQLAMTLSIYQADIDNLIQWVPTDGVWAPENVGKARVNGGTFDLNYRAGDFSHGFNLSVTDPTDQATGERLIRRSKLQASYDLSYSAENLEWSTQINHVGNRIDTTEKLPSYTRFNFSVGYHFSSEWSLKVKVNDLFDEAPTLVSGYEPLGREYFVTISHQFSQ